MEAPRPSPVLDEQSLLEALRRGDAAAAEQLVRDQAGRLLVITRRITGNDEDARDAVQEAFATAFVRLADFDGRSLLSTWIHRIAVNAALGLVRRRNQRGTVSIEEVLPSFFPDGHRVGPRPAWSTGGPEAFDRQRLEEIVRARFAELPWTFAEVLYLRDVQGLDTAATARALGIDAGAVKTRLHRARQALRTLIERDVHP